MMFADIPKEDLEKYSLLLDKSDDEIKKDIHDICKDYYLDYMFNNRDDFKKSADKLQAYLDINIAAVNDYINYCLLVAINTLIEKLYHVKPMDPVNPGFEISRYHQRQAKYFAESYGLSNEEILQTIEYNKQENDLYALRSITDLTIKDKPNIDLPGNVKGTAFANITYLGKGDDAVYNTAKMFLGMSYVMDRAKRDDFKRWFDDYKKQS